MTKLDQFHVESMIREKRKGTLNKSIAEQVGVSVTQSPYMPCNDVQISGYLRGGDTFFALSEFFCHSLRHCLL